MSPYNIPQTADQDPRIDLDSLRNHDLFVEKRDFKIGNLVYLDGELIGRVYQSEAALGQYGPTAAKAWYREDSHKGDRYASDVLAGMAMASDLLLNRCTPDHWPVAEKWAAENELGRRFASGQEFLDWADANGYPHKKPGVKSPTIQEEGYITT